MAANNTLPLLPSNHAIVVPACSDTALVILQGVLKLNAHLITSSGRAQWPDLERLLWNSDPPTPGPFCYPFFSYLGTPP